MIEPVKRTFRRFLILLPVLISISLFAAVAEQFYHQYSAAAASDASGLVLPNGREVGGDFVTFYTAGGIYREDPAKTYDLNLQLERMQQMFAGSGVKSPLILPFVYPPPVAALFGRLASMPLLPAYLCWLAILIAAAVCGIGLTMRAAGVNAAGAAYLAALACGFAPLILDCLAAGQTSGIAIFIVGAAFFLLTRRFDLAAGIILGLGCYKPPLFALIVAGLMIEGRMRTVIGFLFSALLFNLSSVVLMGWNGYLHYLEQTSHYRYGEIFGPQLYLPVYLGVGGYSIICRIFDPAGNLSKVIYLTLIAAALLWFWREKFRGLKSPGDGGFAFRYAALVSFSLWLSPQMNSYDLAVLLVPVTILLTPLFEAGRSPGPKDLAIILSTALLFVEWLLRPAGPESQFLPTAAAFLVWIAMFLINSRPIPGMRSD